VLGELRRRQEDGLIEATEQELGDSLVPCKAVQLSLQLCNDVGFTPTS
jgi:hypothetical protein